MKKNTYAVSGATGFIGRALVEQLLKNGHRVLALVRPGSPRRALLPDSPLLTVLSCSLSDMESFETAERADVFVHLAWEKALGAGREDTDAQWQNVSGALAAVRLAARLSCRHFVGVGSQAEYGPVSEKLRPDTPVCPESGYGVAKYAAGKLTRILCAQLGLSHSWVRVLSVYGEGDAPGTLMMYLLGTLREGKSPELTPCTQIWDYLYVGDAARALLAVGERGRDGAVYPLGSGEARPLCEYVRELGALVAPDVPIAFGARPFYPHQPMYLSADLTALTADTGFSPRISFREGVQRMLQSLSEEK